MSNEPITIDYDSDGNILVTLPSGHQEALDPDKAELLAFALLDTMKDDWDEAR